MNEEDYMLSTYDNPVNPFTDFIEWWKTDMALGHNVCGLLDRLANTSPVFSDEVNEAEIDRVVEDLCRREPTLYRKVYPSTFS